MIKQYAQTQLPQFIGSSCKRANYQKQEYQSGLIIESNGHIYGGIRINYILYIYIPLLILTCLFCNYIAVSTGQEDRFPHTTITNTACHYPQDIVFRFFMLAAGSLVSFIYFIAFKWLKALKKRIGFPYSTQSWVYPWAQMSIVGFYLAIGTIDGAGYPNIHDLGAIFFFIVLFIVAGTITIVVGEMHRWASHAISRTSLLLKIVLMVYLTSLGVYCGVRGLIGKGGQNEDSNFYEVIIEWNLVLVGLAWLLTFVLDWKDVSVTLKGDFGGSLKLIDAAQ